MADLSWLDTKIGSGTAGSGMKNLGTGFQGISAGIDLWNSYNSYKNARETNKLARENMKFNSQLNLANIGSQIQSNNRIKNFMGGVGNDQLSNWLPQDTINKYNMSGSLGSVQPPQGGYMLDNNNNVGQMGNNMPMANPQSQLYNYGGFPAMGSTTPQNPIDLGYNTPEQVR